jgi:hypothetical protein
MTGSAGAIMPGCFRSARKGQTASSGDGCVEVVWLAQHQGRTATPARGDLPDLSVASVGGWRVVKAGVYRDTPTSAF